MNISSGKNFTIIAKLSSQWLFGFRDPSIAQLIYKNGEEGGGAFIFIHFLSPRASLTVSSPVPEPKYPSLSPFTVPCLCTSSCTYVWPLALAPIVARAYCSHAQPSPRLALHCHQPSTAVRAACLSLHCLILRHRFSPLPVPQSESST